MKESLKDIFERVWENYNDFYTKQPTDKEQYLTAKRERIEAASGYSSSLKECVDWVEAVNNDVYHLAVPVTFPPSQLSKEKQKTYRDCVEMFLEDVGRAMRTQGFKLKQIMELKPLTRYLLGYDEIPNMRVIEDLTKDEAKNECNRMKQQGLTNVCYFPTEWFPTKYMAFGYKPQPEQASTQSQLPIDTNNKPESKENPKTILEYLEAKEIPTIAKTDIEYLMFGGALLKQYMYLENGCYHWNLSKALLAFMCGFIYCGDRIKEEDDNKVLKKGTAQLSAKDVNILFPGMNVNSNRDVLKNPPRNSWKIEDLIKDTKKALNEIKQKAQKE